MVNYQNLHTQDLSNLFIGVSVLKSPLKIEGEYLDKDYLYVFPNNSFEVQVGNRIDLFKSIHAKLNIGYLRRFAHNNVSQTFDKDLDNNEIELINTNFSHEINFVTVSSNFLEFQASLSTGFLKRNFIDVGLTYSKQISSSVSNNSSNQNNQPDYIFIDKSM